MLLVIILCLKRIHILDCVWTTQPTLALPAASMLHVLSLWGALWNTECSWESVHMCMGKQHRSWRALTQKKSRQSWELPKCVKMNIPGQSKLHFEFCDQDHSWPKPKSRHFVIRITHDPQREIQTFLWSGSFMTQREIQTKLWNYQSVWKWTYQVSQTQSYTLNFVMEICVYTTYIQGWSFLLLFQVQNFSSLAWL